jgi:peptidoglycan/LPS O-acetylase OafA/YrhL
MIPSHPRRPAAFPIEFNPQRWLGLAKIWAIAVSVVCLLAAGAALVTVDWTFILPWPNELTFAVILAAPAPIYFGLAFFLRRLQYRLCLILASLAALHGLCILVGAIALSDQDEFPWFLAGALGLAAGLAILAIAAFRASRSRQGHDPRRGFDVLPTQS